jgi:hypothetical protein
MFKIEFTVCLNKSSLLHVVKVIMTQGRGGDGDGDGGGDGDGN